MAALTDLSDIVNRTTGGNNGSPETLFFYKDGRVGAAAAAAPVAGRFTSLWQYLGCPFGDGAAPTTVVIPTNATAGAIKQTDPGGSRTKWLLGGVGSGLATGTLILYDRLLHIGSKDATVTTAQTVAGSLTRNTGGVGNQIWLEIYTQIGASSTTVTASYTNQAGTAGQTTQATAIGNTGFREAQRIIPLPLAAGDTGVQACASVTVLATTGTAGVFGITIARPLLVIPIGIAGAGQTRDLIAGLPGVQSIDTGACLALAFMANGATVPTFLGSLSFVEK